MDIKTNEIYCGDNLAILREFPDKIIDCVVTSPPYWSLRNYGVDGQIGLEKTPEQYIEKMVRIFREIRRVLKDSGTVWLNLGDSYAYSGGDGWSGLQSQNWEQKAQPHKVKSLKPKDIIGIPWRVALALQADGWYLRQDIIWHKPNPMPESVKDRFTKAHEYIFFLTKNAKYYFDHNAILEKATGYDGQKDTRFKGGVKYNGFNHQTMLSRGYERWQQNEDGEMVRNKRSVWTVNTKPFKGAHFAVYPPELITPCIKAGCPNGGIVLDPFIGSGTTALVAKKLERKYIGIDINEEYVKLSKKRLSQLTFNF